MCNVLFKELLIKLFRIVCRKEIIYLFNNKCNEKEIDEK